MARFQTLGRAITQIFKPLQTLMVLLTLSLLLSGCVRYDVGIHFAGQQHGEIVQHIRLDEELTNFSGAVARDWLKNLEQRARRLGGRVRHLSKQELVATIPFNNGAELETKFNQFFNPTPEELPQSSLVDLSVKQGNAPNEVIASHLSVIQHNFFLVEKNQLIFDLDLRSLGVLSSEGSVLISPGTLLDLEFSLDTPWGAHSPPSQATPTLSSADSSDKHQVWILKPGDVNHIEATFWIPSPIGMGAVLIMAVVAFGFWIKPNGNYNTLR